MSTQVSEYEKIPTSFRKASGLRTADKATWVVTEKVHGANFSFVYQAGTLRYAKRRAYLTNDDRFFGYQDVATRLDAAIRQLFAALDEEVLPTVPSTAKKFIVYGELFGGSFPSHPDVDPPVVGLPAVQKGIHYAPDIHFMAFDIAVETDGIKRYLDYEIAVTYFERFDVLFAQPLLVGTLQEALNYDIYKDSTVPRLLGLPHVTGNLIEGIVIKPYKNNTLFSKRPIIKIKNKAFCEQNTASHAADSKVKPAKARPRSGGVTYVTESLRRLVNFNRLQSAISKIGPLEDYQDAIKEEVWLDVLREFAEINSYYTLTKKQRQRVRLLVRQSIVSEIAAALSQE